MAKNLIIDYMQFKPVGSLNESNGAKYGVLEDLSYKGYYKELVLKIKTAGFIQNIFY